MIYLKYCLKILKSLCTDTLKTAFRLFKIMIPLSIAVKILQEQGWIVYLGYALSPMMKSVGLPGEIGLVWASTMLTNIYGGMLIFYTLADSLTITGAQVTVMATLMLIAHTLPVELQVARMAGLRLFTMFLIRFSFAFVGAWGLNQIYSLGGWLQDPAVLTQIIGANNSGNLIDWTLNELHRYLEILFYVFCLLALMRFLKFVGFINILTTSLKPVLRVLGIHESVIPITVIGSTLGILYGGALIIKEAEETKINKMDIFYAMTLMGLCHSLIEDSILMLSLGADYSGVFIFRMIFAFIVTYLIVKITQAFPHIIKRQWLVRS